MLIRKIANILLRKIKRNHCKSDKPTMNDDAALYSKNNKIQKSEANYILENYLKFLKWGNNDTILDVGAGEGTVSLEVLLPKLPSFRKLVLLDISSKMLNYAKCKNVNKKVDFLQMDITTKTIPKHLLESFDHIFSFFCLNWIVDETQHKQALKNLYKMLKPGGDMLLVIIATGPALDFWENLAKNEKWAPFVKNIEKVISPYHHLKNPEEKLRCFLEESNFEILVCESQQTQHSFPTLSNYTDFLLWISPLAKFIPKNQLEDHIQDLQKEIRKHREIDVEICEDGTEKFYQTHKILIACASKWRVQGKNTVIASKLILRKIDFKINQLINEN